MKRNKRGISLIVLVITIIVMIILAASVIISLDNSGIIEKTNNAVKGYNIAQIQTAATLIWSEEYIENEENLNSEYIRGKLEQQGIKTDNYDIIVSETGVVVKPIEDTKSEEGIYFDRLYEVGNEEDNIGFVFHEDGSFEQYTQVNETMFCTFANPKDSITFTENIIEFQGLTAEISEDGLTITSKVPEQPLVLTCNFTDVHGIYNNKTYSNDTEDVTIILDDNNVGTINMLGQTLSDTVSVTGNGHLLTVLGQTFNVSLDGKKIYWVDESIVLEVEGTGLVIGDWVVAWTYNNGKWSDRIESGNPTGEFVVKLYPLDKKVTPSERQTLYKLKLEKDTAYKMVIEGSGNMPSVADLDESDATFTGWSKEGILSLVKAENYDISGKHHIFYISDVEFDENITSIGEGCLAFMPSLESINIPSHITSIEKEAFALSAIKSISIPDTVTSIGEGVFELCMQLTSANLPSHMTEIPEKLFEDCGSLTSVTIPSGVASIGKNAFASTAIESINLPKGLTSIGEYAFYGVNTTSIEIPENVTSIGIGAFANTNLVSITLPSNITEIPDELLSECSNLESIIIPSKVTTIGKKAFYYSSALKTVTIQSAALSSVGEDAFTGIADDSRIILPNSTLLSLFVDGVNYDSSDTTIEY